MSTRSPALTTPLGYSHSKTSNLKRLVELVIPFIHSTEEESTATVSQVYYLQMLCNLHAIIVYLKVIEIMFYIHLKQLNSKINEIVFSKQNFFFFFG